ncbi:MAG: inositol monophosphatase [Alphaproteobacteria bacterium]|nr:inositol monophosphatase [Alphaproteobacteria bacterium]
MTMSGARATDPRLAARLRLGEALIAEAGATALAAFTDPALAVTAKGEGDLVTEIDFAIEKRLRAAIVATFPEDKVFGEEGGGEIAGVDGFTWLIDPIDGTINFARGIGYFCVSLALFAKGRTIAAWIVDPVRNEVFWADPEGRAYLGAERLRLHGEALVGTSLIGLGFSRRHAADRTVAIIAALDRGGAEFRRLGAGALCLAHVAAGRLDAYLEPHMNPWDALGGLYIAHCAGAAMLPYAENGDIAAGGVVFAAAPGLAAALLTLLPDPFSGTPPHLENDQRSAGEAAT